MPRCASAALTPASLPNSDMQCRLCELVCGGQVTLLPLPGELGERMLLNRDVMSLRGGGGGKTPKDGSNPSDGPGSKPKRG